MIDATLGTRYLQMKSLLVQFANVSHNNRTAQKIDELFSCSFLYQQTHSQFLTQS